MADGLEKFTMPTIQVPPMPPRVKDPLNPGVLIEDRGAMIMWEGELRHLPTRRNDLRNGRCRATHCYGTSALHS